MSVTFSRFTSVLLLSAAALALPMTALHSAETPAPAASAAPRVSVLKVIPEQIVERIDVSGTFVARDEVLVSPQVEGLQITEILVDEGDKVKKGQVLARLNRATLDAQLAQWNATLAVADAAIAQANSNIEQAHASLALSAPALARAQDLYRTGAGTNAVLEQRQADQRANEARLASAKSGLALAQADKAAKEAQRNELLVRLARTDVVAPVDGTITRKSARLGAIASAAGDPMFRLAAQGIVELEADVPEQRLSRVKDDQPATISIADQAEIAGHVRLVSPEVDKVTRLGKVRISFAEDARAHIGAFARGTIELSRRNGLVVPAASIIYDNDSTAIQTVVDNHVQTRKVTLGLIANARAEVVSGLAEGDSVIERAGAFLRSGDAVMPVEQTASTKLGGNAQ